MPARASGRCDKAIANRPAPSGSAAASDYEFIRHPSAIAKPLVADVHPDAENGRALEVATGAPGLMIVAVDNQGDLSLYAGPVSSFYSFDVALGQRMSDTSWRKELEGPTPPKHPAFTQSYWAE